MSTGASASTAIETAWELRYSIATIVMGREHGFGHTLSFWIETALLLRKSIIFPQNIGLQMQKISNNSALVADSYCLPGLEYSKFRSRYADKA